MRRPYFSDKSSRWIAVADSAAILLSVTVALVIRAQFQAYLVQPLDILVLLPWLLVLRVMTNVVFEHYSLNVSSFAPRDFSALLIHNLMPSAIMTALRLAQPTSFLQMPLSVIGMEYIFSCFGFLIIRFGAINMLMSRPSTAVRHRPHVLLWGEVREIIDGGLLAVIEAKGEARVIGILSSNALFWDTEVMGTRVYGDESRLPALVGLDESISLVCFVNPRSEARASLWSVIREAQRLHLSLGIVASNGEIEEHDAEYLFRN